MKRLLVFTPLIAASISLGHASINFYSSNDSETVLNRVYSNILSKNLANDCKDVFLGYSHREEITDAKNLVGLDLGIGDKVYNLGTVKEVQLSNDSKNALVYAYDSDYTNSSSILETLKDKSVINENLKNQIEESLSFQPRYRIVVDTKTNKILSISSGYKRGDNFQTICGK